jgi:hypothetical protein
MCTKDGKVHFSFLLFSVRGEGGRGRLKREMGNFGTSTEMTKG